MLGLTDEFYSDLPHVVSIQVVAWASMHKLLSYLNTGFSAKLRDYNTGRVSSQTPGRNINIMLKLQMRMALGEGTGKLLPVLSSGLFSGYGQRSLG